MGELLPRAFLGTKEWKDMHELATRDLRNTFRTKPWHSWKKQMLKHPSMYVLGFQHPNYEHVRCCLCTDRPFAGRPSDLATSFSASTLKCTATWIVCTWNQCAACRRFSVICTPDRVV